MHSTKHYQKAKDIKNGKFSKNKYQGKSKHGSTKNDYQDRLFMGNTTMVKSITQVSRIKETIRDKHLLKYIGPDAHLLDPGPEPIKPDLDPIRDQIRVLERINLIDEYEDSDDIDEYVDAINESSIEVPKFLLEHLGTLELIKNGSDEEDANQVLDAIALVKDRVLRENKKRKKEFEALLNHQKYLLELKRDKESDYDRDHKEWIRRDREFKDDTEKLALIFAKSLGPNVKGLVKIELEKKDYYGVIHITSYFIKDGTSFRSSIDGRINEEEIQGLYESSINIFFGTNHYMALIPKTSIR